MKPRIKTLSTTKWGETIQTQNGSFAFKAGGQRLGTIFYKVVLISSGLEPKHTTVAEFDGPDAQHFARLTAARLNGAL